MDCKSIVITFGLQIRKSQVAKGVGKLPTDLIARSSGFAIREDLIQDL